MGQRTQRGGGRGRVRRKGTEKAPETVDSLGWAPGRPLIYALARTEGPLALSFTDGVCVCPAVGVCWRQGARGL